MALPVYIASLVLAVACLAMEPAAAFAADAIATATTSNTPSADGAGAGRTIELTRDISPARAKRLAMSKPLHNKLDTLGRVIVNRGGTGHNIPNPLPFTANVEVGTPPQNLLASFSTATSDSWFLGNGCESCQSERYYNRNASSTADQVSDSASERGVSGPLVTDRVSLANLTAHHLHFIDASSVSDDSTSSFQNGQGQIGFGAFQPAFDHYKPYIPLLEFDRELNCHHRVFAFYFGDEKPRSVNIGGYDKDAFWGELTDVTMNPSTNWQVTLSYVSVGTTNLGHVISQGDNVYGNLDSASTFIYGPHDAVLKFMNVLGGTNVAGEYIIDCQDRDWVPPLTFTIDSQDWMIRGRDYIYADDDTCLVGVMPHNWETENQWVLGEPFLRRVYTVFDQSEQTVRMAYTRSTATKSVLSTASTTTAMVALSLFIVAGSFLGGF